MGLCILLVAVTVCLSVPSTRSKPLGVLTHDDLGVARRVRRSLPYEADMMSYVPSEPVINEPLYPDLNQAMIARFPAYPQELLARALERMSKPRRVEPTHDSPSLQQLIEEGQRRDKETMYLANLLHLWNQINQGKAYVNQLQGFPGPVPSDISEYQRQFQDYDDTGVVASRARPQISRNQMAQALQSHYRQNRAFEGPALHHQPEETNEDGYPMDEDMLRYLVTRVLSAMNDAEMSQRLPPGPPRRMRRSLEDNNDEDTPANLLRVKRLDIDNAVPDYTSNGLLHRKRIESDRSIQNRPQHFTDQRVTEQLLKYFPE